jgi:integrase
MPRKAKELKAIEVQRLTAAGVHAVGVVPGLCLQVREPDAVANDGAHRACRTWILRTTVGNKRRWIGLGGYPEVTLAQAHERARAARDLIRSGVDPIERRREAKSALIAARATAMTFKEVAALFIEKTERKWKNAKHAQQWRNTLETYAYPVIGGMLARDIQRDHVAAVLTPIADTKPETASRLRGRIEQVLDYATQYGHRPEGWNPARLKGNLDKVVTARKPRHHRTLPADQLGEFMCKLRAQEGIGAKALELAILTAARSGEVRGAKWSEVDLTNAVWRIPGDRMKAGNEHRVPLSRAAVKLLKAMPQPVSNDVYIFPGRRSGRPLSDMSLTQVTRTIGVDAVPHGFRSTFRDWVAERTNYPNEVAEAALAHTVANKVEAAYRRGDLFDKRRRMMEDWAAFCAAPVTPAKVVSITSRKRA